MNNCGRPLGGADIDHGEHDGLANLLCRKPDAFGGVHGLEHVGSELANLGRDAVDAFALLAQCRVPVFEDVQNHEMSITVGYEGVKVEGNGGLPTGCVLC